MGEPAKSLLRRLAVPILAGVLLPALVMTLLNAAKPLHIDDPYYYQVAAQIAAHPLDPYGFELFWYQWPHPASEEMVNPVLPYWVALCMRLFGSNPFACKLGLLPFSLCLTWGLYSLFRRFARGLEVPLTWMTALSPAFLPGFNLMVDVPAMALELAALEFFFRASERKSLGTAIVAGLLAGLAMQTKYPAVIVVPVMALYALLFRKLRAALVSIPIALALFAGWEWLMTMRYGQGMLLGHMTHYIFESSRATLLRDVVPVLGAIAPAVALLGLMGFGFQNWVVVLIGIILTAPFVLMVSNPLPDGWFLGFGIILTVVLTVFAWQLCRLGRGGLWQPRRWWSHRVNWFLVLWLLGELVTYLIISPFPAVRRVMGMVVVATLLCGRMTAIQCRLQQASYRAVVVVSACGVALGLWYFLADFSHALALRDAPRRAVAEIKARNPNATIWFVGHWGFQFEAERVGMRPLIPDYSFVRRGDFVVVAARIHLQQVSVWETQEFVQSAKGYSDFPPSVSLVPGYYHGNRPLVHRSLKEPQAPLTTFQAVTDVVPRTSWEPRQMAHWAMQAAPERTAKAVPALIHSLNDEDPRVRVDVVNALAKIGPRASEATDALQEMLNDEDEQVRAAAVRALEAVGNSSKTRKDEPVNSVP